MTEENTGPKADETSFENERAGTADKDPIAVALDDPQVRHAGVRPSTPHDQEMFSMNDKAENPREVSSEEFHVPVADVIKGAEDEQFSSVAIVGINHDGEVIVSGSHGTPLVKDLLRQGLDTIDTIAEMEDEADGCMEAPPAEEVDATENPLPQSPPAPPEDEAA